MAKKGYIYKGLKSCTGARVKRHWRGQIEYYNRRSRHFVRFPVIDGKGKITDIHDTWFVIWTTTPGQFRNLAICLHPDIPMCGSAHPNGGLILAEELLAEVMEVWKYHPTLKKNTGVVTWKEFCISIPFMLGSRRLFWAIMLRWMPEPAAFTRRRATGRRTMK